MWQPAILCQDFCYNACRFTSLLLPELNNPTTPGPKLVSNLCHKMSQGFKVVDHIPFEATHALAAVLLRHGVRDHEAYIGDRTYDSLIAFADNLAFSAGQPHHYVRCGPTS